MDVLPKNIDIEELLEPLERAIGDGLIPSITGHTCTTSEREPAGTTSEEGGTGTRKPSTLSELDSNTQCLFR